MNKTVIQRNVLMLSLTVFECLLTTELPEGFQTRKPRSGGAEHLPSDRKRLWADTGCASLGSQPGLKVDGAGLLCVQAWAQEHLLDFSRLCISNEVSSHSRDHPLSLYAQGCSLASHCLSLQKVVSCTCWTWSWHSL